jgi:hypothetical protein
MDPRESLSLYKLSQKTDCLTLLSTGVRGHTLLGARTDAMQITQDRYIFHIDRTYYKQNRPRVDAGYGSGSTRAAVTSKALAEGAPLDMFLASGGWSRPSTFQQFYARPIGGPARADYGLE